MKFLICFSDISDLLHIDNIYKKKPYNIFAGEPEFLHLIRKSILDSSVVVRLILAGMHNSYKIKLGFF